VDFRVERRGEELFVRSEYRSSSQQPPFVAVVDQMRRLKFEFKGMRGGSTGMASGVGELLTDAPALALMLVGLQVAFGVIGMIGRRRAARNGWPMTPLLSDNHARAVGAGVLGGLALLGMGLVYAKVLQSILGHEPPSPWNSAAAMPVSTKMVFLFFGALGAPLAEEIFFRGYLFGKFKAAGYVSFGIFVSSVLFGAVHFSDAYNVPATALYGVSLAWLYHRTGSLLAPIVAHAINNGVAIACMIWG
jgi:membrane protease YdiL (CAAX protease family)